MPSLHDIHFIRPWAFWFLIPLAMTGLYLMFRRPTSTQSWSRVCDKHLLPHLMQHGRRRSRYGSVVVWWLAMKLTIIALAGPAWVRLPTPTYQHIQPRVLVLDLSSDMLEHDLAPSRLERAKFKCQDLLKAKDVGQFGLVVYTGEPFVVSPLTDDGHTIAALLPMLSPDIMPVFGYHLGKALDEASDLISQAGYTYGQVLVFTGRPPSHNAIRTASALAKRDIHTSIIPMSKDTKDLSAFKALAKAGQGNVFPFSDTNADIQGWLSATKQQKRYDEMDQSLPVWRDEGRWVLIPALILLLLTCRRDWWMRIFS